MSAADETIASLIANVEVAKVFARASIECDTDALVGLIAEHARMKATLEKIAAFDLREQPGPYSAGFNKCGNLLKSWATRCLDGRGQ